jgi:hypothetical protein
MVSGDYYRRRVRAGSVIPPISRSSATPSVSYVLEEPQVQRVEVTFVGHPPTRQVQRASGVSEVEVAGRILRCTVFGSFQPFLEAIRGHEVISLRSIHTGE